MNNTDSWECQGRDEKGRFGDGTCGDMPELDTPANIKDLASILENEAGGVPEDRATFMIKAASV